MKLTQGGRERRREREKVNEGGKIYVAYLIKNCWQLASIEKKDKTVVYL